MLDVRRVLSSAPRKHDRGIMADLTTPWPIETDSYPRPQIVRKEWICLNGWWTYYIQKTNKPYLRQKNSIPPLPEAKRFCHRIRVPFSPEAPASEAHHLLKPDEILWYQRQLPDCDLSGGKRCILHFQAVDYSCDCWVGTKLVAQHRGGYTAFSCDITEALSLAAASKTTKKSKPLTLTLAVVDPSDQGHQLRGKQRLNPSDIWYSAQSGIWQTIWLEIVPPAYIRSLKILPNPDERKLTVRAAIINTKPNKNAHNHVHNHTSLSLSLALLTAQDQPLARKTLSLNPQAATISANLELNLPHPHPRLWSPDDPYCYHLEITLDSVSYQRISQAEAPSQPEDPAKQEQKSPLHYTDSVSSYCAFRTISLNKDSQGQVRFCLNHKPYFLKGLLDQGYWPEGLMTAPSDQALIHDIQTAKDMGFNMLRKHIKVECDRWYYLCDTMGILVWQDMVSGGDSPYNVWTSSRIPTFFQFSWNHLPDNNPRLYAALGAGNRDFRREWTETCQTVVRSLSNHPCIVTWGLFNEAWGQFEARKATAMVGRLDPTRLIDATSGWYDQGCGDFTSVHNYFRPLTVPRFGRKRASLISECGGLTYPVPGHSSFHQSYGYASYQSGATYRTAVKQFLNTIQSLESQGLSGYIYTQLSDIEEETNGLMTYDRRVNKLLG